MLILQPLFVYFALFTDDIDLDESSNDKNDEKINLALLVITPSFAYFYMETFWYAFSLLMCVNIVGIILAKIVERKAKRNVDFKQLTGFVFSWLMFFGLCYWLIDFSFAEHNSTNGNSSYYEKYWPTLYFLILMLSTLTIKIIETRFDKPSLSGSLLFISAILIGALPLLGSAYIFGVVFNIFIFIVVCSLCIEIEKRNDPSAGAIIYIYAFVLFGSIAFSSVSKLVYKAFIV